MTQARRKGRLWAGGGVRTREKGRGRRRPRSQERVLAGLRPAA